MKPHNVARAMLAAVSIAAISSCTTLAPSFTAQPSRALTTLPCPPLRTYSEREMQQAGAELDRLGPDAALADFMDDYLYIRDACR